MMDRDVWEEHDPCTDTDCTLGEGTMVPPGCGGRCFTAADEAAVDRSMHVGEVARLRAVFAADQAEAAR